MLSSAVIIALSQSLDKLTALKTCAYHWDPTTQQLSPKLNFIQMLLYAINTTYEVLVLVPYLIVQPGIILENNQNISKITIPLVFYLGPTIYVTIQVTYLFTGYHYETFVSKFFQSEYKLGKTGLISRGACALTKTPKKNLVKFVSISILLRQLKSSIRRLKLIFLGSKNKLDVRPRWDYLIEFGINALDLFKIGFVICIISYLSLPSTTVANTCFHFFGKYHWSGYIFAVSIGWFVFAACTLANTNVFLVVSYLLSTSATLKLLR